MCITTQFNLAVDRIWSTINLAGMETNIFTEKRDVHCTQTISQEGKKREQNKISPLI